jgi:hypothetical protein
MAFLFGAFLGLVVGVAVAMAFVRIENTRAEQRRELVRVNDAIPLPHSPIRIASASLVIDFVDVGD